MWDLLCQLDHPIIALYSIIIVLKSNAMYHTIVLALLTIRDYYHNYCGVPCTENPVSVIACIGILPGAVMRGKNRSV